MFQVGDRAVYGMHGVCDVKDQETKLVDKKMVTYLVLEPLGQPGSRYLVPKNNSLAMEKLKKILTRDELETMIGSAEVHQDQWIPDEGRRKQIYRELISKGDRIKLMGMVCTLYRHRKQQAASGRKVHLCDENFLRDAEKVLSGEIAIVMNMDQEEARKYIRDKLIHD